MALKSRVAIPPVINISMAFTDKADLPSPVIVPRSGHTVTRKLISENALKVLRRLNSQGYTFLWLNVHDQTIWG